MKIKKLSLYFPLLAFSALSLQAVAQESANQEEQADESNGIELIMVTAQRKSQSLQEAAVPMLAVDQKSLTRQGLESGQDLGRHCGAGKVRLPYTLFPQRSRFLW